MLYILNFPNHSVPDSIRKIELENKKILLVSPHADDISISCGATVNFLSQNNEILPVLFFEESKVREKEAQREAKILNTKKPFFLKLNSHHFPKNLEKDVAKTKKLLQEFNPDIIFLPQKNDLHPSHKLATSITLKSLSNHSLKLFFYESPWFLFNNLGFNAVTFFSEKELKRKLKAIKAHKSQNKNNYYDQIAKSLAVFRGNVIPEQRIFGYGKNKMKGYLAESFFYENNN